MQRLYGSSDMLQIDTVAIEEFGIPSSLLMENAGRGTYNFMYHKLGSASHSFAPIFIGPGNNGGDGFVVGRHLAQHGCTPLFFILASKEQLSADSLLSFHIIEKMNLPFFFIEDNIAETVDAVCQKQILCGKSCYAVVDALFGVGLDRDIGGRYKEAIEYINSLNSNPLFSHPPTVFACDIPSGINANNGSLYALAVKAHFTATYSFAKAGLMQGHGKVYSGSVKIIDIGVPPLISESHHPLFYRVNGLDIQNILLKKPRNSSAHKGDHGHVLLIGGSKGMAGAILLCGKASLSMGSGLTSIYVPSYLRSVLENQLIEAMTCTDSINSNSEFLRLDDIQDIKAQITKRDVIAIGPGLGVAPDTVDLVCALYKDCQKPLIVDADAINALAKNRASLIAPDGPRIFTPHQKEMGRLLGIDAEDVQNDRRKAVQDFLHFFADCDHEIVVILKGEASLVASNKSTEIYLNSSGNSAMATGGMGDVLTGMITSLVAQGFSYLDATIAGTYLHGDAGDYLQHEMGIGFTASHIAESLPLCRKMRSSTK